MTSVETDGNILEVADEQMQNMKPVARLPPFMAQGGRELSRISRKSSGVAQQLDEELFVFVGCLTISIFRCHSGGVGYVVMAIAHRRRDP